jgi:CubicO group peptidase (beta-lactamase class C family)
MKMFMLLATFLGCLWMEGKAQKPGMGSFAYADSVMQARYKAGKPGAVLLIARDGHPVFEKAYGMANMELKIPNRTNYNFEIGSNTKQFTAVSVLQLVGKGKLSLQDDMRKYLRDYNTHGRRITIENLLTHTSGIPSYTEDSGFADIMQKDLSKDSIMRWMSRDSLLFEPGTDWSYSNSGYFLLGMIIEKVAGVSYESYVQKNILDPLHMDSTYFGSSKKVIPGLVTGYEPASKGQYRDASYISWSWPYAAGEMISTVNDLLKWDNALYTHKLADRDLLQKAWTSYTLKDGAKTHYGYGWMLGNYQGVKMIFHSGGIPGFLSVVIRLPEQHMFLALLSNNTKMSPVPLAMLVAFHAAGHPLTRPPAIKSDPGTLAEYIGVYQVHSISGRVASNFRSAKIYNYITLKRDTLFMQPVGGSPTALIPIAKDVFIPSGKERMYQTYDFLRDKQGKVDAIKIYAPLDAGIVRTEPKTNLPLPEEKHAIALSADVLKQYAGKYNYKSVFNITITVKGDKIYATGDGQAPNEIFPESKTKFYAKSVDAQIEFKKDGSGKVEGFTLYQAGKHEFKKVE